MKFGYVAARCALAAACALGAAAPAVAQFWQCAPYARAVSGIQLRGNADTWWGQAAGRYGRGQRPREGAVLAFRATARMRVGHVATVARVLGEREVLLNHANWSRAGGVEQDARAVDVSAAGDWSLVRVWYGPTHDLGTSSYPTSGFIYGDGAGAPEAEAPSRVTPVVIAASVPVGRPSAVDYPLAVSLGG